jgi:hypothetical protein
MISKETVMSFANRSIVALESLFVVVIAAWSVLMAVALFNPGAARERQGVVEIYTLVANDTRPTA